MLRYKKDQTFIMQHGTQSLLSSTLLRNSDLYRSLRIGHIRIPCRQWSTCGWTDEVMRHQYRDTYLRSMSKLRRLQHQQQPREMVSTHKNYFPDSFVYRRGDHPYGTREYILVRPKPNDEDDDNNIDDTTKSGHDASQTATVESLPNEVIVLATIHANNNIVFGANVNQKVIQMGHHETDVKPPSILDLCPILLHSALTDCSNEGEQPQALSTLHGLSAWVRQCLDEDSPIQSNVIQSLREQIMNPSYSSNRAIGQQIQNLDAHQQLECITAIATNTPRPGHSVVGQKTHAHGAFAWEALAREYAVLDYNDDTISVVQLSEECLLYQQYTESCELVEIELLADTSPSYLLSAGGAMARFFIM
jgi:hypothetical protein